MTMNAIWNANNPNQGPYKHTLTVCSAGLLRSATLAWYLTRNTDDNLRNCGVYDYALIRYNSILHTWADKIIFAQQEHYDAVKDKFDFSEKEVIILDLPDVFPYRDPMLIKFIKEQLDAHSD